VGRKSIALVLVLAAALALSACGSAKVSESALLSEMQANFGADVTSVKVSGSSGNVRLDVYTSYYADPDVAETARGMAAIAAQSQTVLDQYPSTTIEAYVWPSGKEFYMTRVTAVYEDGKLAAPMDVFVNDVLQ
jgi:hypothetical protein